MITVHHLKTQFPGEEQESTIGFTIVIDTHESMQSFRQLIQRGANLWPDAQPEIKDFADEITNGKVLQDYRAQAKDKIKTTAIRVAYHCTCGHTTARDFIGVPPDQIACDACSRTVTYSKRS